MSLGEDPYRVDSDESGNKHGSVFVGEADLVEEIGSAFGPFMGWEIDRRRQVTFAFGDERFTGDLSCGVGWGYSEYTPMDADKLLVGPHDILAILGQHEGKKATVWFADEPFNPMEPAS